MFETWRSVPSPLLKGYSGTIQHLTVEKVIGVYYRESKTKRRKNK